MRIKSFSEYITEELRKVISDQSGSGKTKSVEWIWDEPTSAKSPSAGVSLKDELRELEFQDLIKTLSHDELDNKSKSRLRKERFKAKPDKLAVTLNNLRFLKDEQKEKGELRCEYCGKGPLVIYDITEDELKRGPQKIDGRLRFNTKFNPKDGATADHKQPQSKGGDKFNYSNLAVCCYRCNQRKGNMDWEKWSDVLKNRQFNESSKNLENRILISDLFLSVADEYNIKECQWNREDSGSWLSWYSEGNLINHFDLENWTSNESYTLRIFYRGNQHQQFSEDLDRFLERLRKFGFKNFKAQKENYTYDGKIYSVIIKSSSLNESTIPLKNYMKELTGLDEEDLQDNLLELSDEYDLKFEPGMFLLDEYGRPKTKNHWDIKDQVEFMRYIDSNRVKQINGKLIPDINEDDNFAWGWIVEFWKKGEPTYRNNRVCDKQTIKRTYSKINQNRLESLGLDSAVVMTHSTGGRNIDNDVYAIAIWSIN